MKEKLKTDKDLTFKAIRGDSIATRLTHVLLQDNKDGTAVFSLSITVGYDVYQTIRQDGLFNSFAEPLLMGITEDDFAVQPVEVELQLKSVMVDTLYEQINTPAEVADYLAQLKVDSPLSYLLHTENWLATAFQQLTLLPPELQETGELKIGYLTIWSKPEQIRRQLVEQFSISPKEVIIEYLQSHQFEYEFIEEAIFRLQYQGQNGQWICLLQVDEAQQKCCVYSIYPEVISVEQRRAVAIFIANLNYDLTFGNFEIDLEDGDLRYRTSINLANSRFNQELLDQLIVDNIRAMDNYLSDVQKIQQLHTESIQA